MRKIAFIVGKEVKHILRDPRSLAIAIAMPVLMMLLYGYAVNLDTKNIKLAVVDQDGSALSRELVTGFYETGYFVRPLAEPDPSDPERVLRSDDAHAVLVLRPGFAAAILRGTPYQVGLLVDGADANRAAAATNYSNLVLSEFLRGRFPEAASGPAIEISRQVLYNPDLRSPDFFVPGLIAVILMMISALLTSVTVVREKEAGTMEQLLTCPVSPGQIVVGKVIPYLGLAFLDGLLVILFGVFHFQVPFEGSRLLLVLFGVIYIVAALSIGVLISTVVSTQLVAMLAALVATVLPAVMMSGFIFEIKNMPEPLQVVSAVIPARHFLVIIRGIMLKGAGIGVLWEEALALVVITLVPLSIAIRNFRSRLV